MKVSNPFGAVVLVACMIPGCRDAAPAPEIVRPVVAMRVSDAAAFEGRWFPGRAKATREANVAFEVSGRMVERPVLVGSNVEEGQVLGRLDPRDFRNGLSQAQARLEQATAYRDRIAEAARSGAVSQQDLTDAEAAQEISVAEVEIRQKALEDTELTSPFAGTISATLVENFENVRAKQGGGVPIFVRRLGERPLKEVHHAEPLGPGREIVPVEGIPLHTYHADPPM